MFDADFFIRLATLDQNLIAPVQVATGRPLPLVRIGEVYTFHHQRQPGLVDYMLVDRPAKLVAQIRKVQQNRQGASFHGQLPDAWVPYPAHLWLREDDPQRPMSRSRQLNLAFTSGPDRTHWELRIGLGFPTDKAEGFQHYDALKNEIRRRPSDFDDLFDYWEGIARTTGALSGDVLADRGGDWRFVGICLRHADPLGRLCLENTEVLAQVVQDYFARVQSARF